MAELNLFGEMQDDPKHGPRSGKYQSFKVLNKYRPSDDKAVRCRNCVNLIGMGGHSKTYYKCKLMGTSMSIATDIRVNHVCEQFKGESK